MKRQGVTHPNQQTRDESQMPKDVSRYRHTDHTESAIMQPTGYRKFQSPVKPITPKPNSFTGTRFTHDFSHVPVHAKMEATDSERMTDTQALNFGPDTRFGTPAYASNTGGQEPLTEVEWKDRIPPISYLPHKHLQNQHSLRKKNKSSISNNIMAEAKVIQPPESVPLKAKITSHDKIEILSTNLLVEDLTHELGPGQMKVSDFLSQLEIEVRRVAEEALRGTGQTTESCPYLTHWFGYYSQKSSDHVERAIHKYASETSNVSEAKDYIPLISERVRQAVKIWARTGEITGVPEGISTDLLREAPVPSGEDATTSTGTAMLTARDSSGVADNPQKIQSQLGDGRPLESGVRLRMESAFGMDFAHVRTHTGSTAARLSNRLDARAFTVGEHVVFRSGEYQPGTLVGDALIAHELAHVVQQDGESCDSEQEIQTENPVLERDADVSTVGAVSSMYLGLKEALTNISQNAMPRLRSGLRLQRCKFPSYSEIVSDSAVQTATDAAWASTEAATTKTSRREEGFWIRLNTASKKYEFTNHFIGPTVGNATGASATPGVKPADTPNPKGATHTVALFHTHTPTAHRSVGRGVGPSGVDDKFHNKNNVVGVVYDYKASPPGSGNIPAGHPIGSPAKRYHSGPNRRSA